MRHKLQMMIVRNFSLCLLILLLQPHHSQADFFEFMSTAMRFMGRVMGMDPSPESRAESDPSKTADRIKALHDAAQFVSEARNKAGQRVLKNRIERLRSSMGAEGLDPISSDSASSSSSDTLAADTSSDSATSSASSLDSLLSDTDSLADLLKERSTLANRRNLNVALAKLLARKLRERKMQRRAGN